MQSANNSAYSTRKNHISKKITLAVIVKNEDARIGEFIEAHNEWANILIVDDHSTDNTVSIAKNYKVSIMSFKYDGYFSRKNIKEIFKNTETSWNIICGIGIRIPSAAFYKIEDIQNENPFIYGINLFRQSYSYNHPTHSSKRWYNHDHRDTTSCMCINKDYWNENLSRIHREFPIIGNKENIALLPPTEEYTVRHYRNGHSSCTEAKHNRYSSAEAAERFADGETCGIIKALVVPLKILTIMLILSPKNKYSYLATLQHFHYELQVYLKLAELTANLLPDKKN